MGSCSKVLGIDGTEQVKEKGGSLVLKDGDSGVRLSLISIAEASLEGILMIKVDRC